MIRKLVLIALLANAGLFAQKPAITSIQNPASNILPGLPNYGMAQGQIFVLYGSNLGPSTIAQAPALPLSNSLAGVSVSITSGGNGFPAPIVYALSTQLAAVLPSDVPAGTPAAVQVTYNGTASNSVTFPVTASNFGVSTADQTGSGDAVITYPTSTAPFYGLVTQMNSAVPGNTYTMWGTGLGAANSDSNVATNGDLGTPVQVFVGGLPASVTYRGRSGGPGLDQINFTIPQGVPTGCHVGLIVQTRGVVSNAPTLPIAPNGGPCSDVSVSFPIIAAALAAKGSATVAGLDLEGEGKNALAFFLKFSPQQAATASVGRVSLGSCTTYIQVGSGSGDNGLPASTGLDAGTAITLTPPTGAPVSLSLQAPGVYAAAISGVASGTYQASNGTGGKDIGAFSVSFTGLPAFTWTNAAAAASVTRSQGLTLTWTGGDANSWLDIQGGGGGTNPAFPGVVAFFECFAPAAAGTFTIPAPVLMAIPAQPNANPNPTGFVQAALQTVRQISIPGADAAFVAVNGAPTPTQVSFK